MAGLGFEPRSKTASWLSALPVLSSPRERRAALSHPAATGITTFSLFIARHARRRVICPLHGSRSLARHAQRLAIQNAATKITAIYYVGFRRATVVYYRLVTHRTHAHRGHTCTHTHCTHNLNDHTCGTASAVPQRAQARAYTCAFFRISLLRRASFARAHSTQSVLPFAYTSQRCWSGPTRKQ